MEPLFIGIEIGGTKIQVVSSQVPPQIDGRFRAQVDPQQGAAGILREIENGLAELLDGALPRAVGIGFGGPVDTDRLQVARSHQIAGWDGFPLGDWIQERCRCPVHMDNDANVAALAEAIYGAGRSHNPVFYVTLGSGVGGGLVQRGKIYHGEIPGESEIGHLRLNRTGLILEASCSGWAVNQKVQAAIEADSQGQLALLSESNPAWPLARLLGPALAQRVPAAQTILSATVDDLAFGLSHVVHLQHPQVIILGGGLSLLGEPLRLGVSEALPQYLMETMLPAPSIKLAELKEDMVPIGALALAQESDRSTAK